MDFPSVDIRHDISPDQVATRLAGRDKPVILKGLVSAWPAVERARRSTAELIDYLKACDAGRPAETFRQASGGDGKYFYDEGSADFNFQRAAIPLKMTLDRLNELGGASGRRAHLYPVGAAEGFHASFQGGKSAGGAGRGAAHLDRQSCRDPDAL